MSLRARVAALFKIEADPAKIVQSYGERVSKSGIPFTTNSFFGGAPSTAPTGLATISYFSSSVTRLA